MGACTAERECIRLTQTWLRFALTASLPMVGSCPTSSALPPVHRNWHRLHPRNPDSNSPWCTFVSSPTSALSPPIQCTLSWIYAPAPEPAVGHKVPFAAIRMYNDKKKHHKNCECSRSLSNCKSLPLNVMIQVSQFVSNICHFIINSLSVFF